jgi:biopolymer transport protein ExbB/TolQ/biopolymer transport protein ExbD
LPCGAILVMPPIIEREIEALQPDDTEGVVKLSRMVRNDNSTLARITQVGLQNLTWPKMENLEAVQTKARYELLRLESGLFILEIIIGIAPLLGLLGAVAGLVKVFAAFGANAAATDPRMMANGISEALSTTIVGLAIAIPSLIAYSVFLKEDRDDGQRHGIARQRTSLEVLSPEAADRSAGKTLTALQRNRLALSLRCTGGDGAVNFYQKRRRRPEVIIVSLIDIFAILLIFMVMTTQFKEDKASVTIKLPESKTAVVTAQPAKSVVLSIAENEELFLDAKKIEVDALKPAILELMKQQPQPTLALNADKKAPFGVVIRVLDVLKEAGVRGNLSAFTEVKK